MSGTVGLRLKSVPAVWRGEKLWFFKSDIFICFLVSNLIIYLLIDKKYKK